MLVKKIVVAWYGKIDDKSVKELYFLEAYCSVTYKA